MNRRGRTEYDGFTEMFRCTPLLLPPYLIQPYRLLETFQAGLTLVSEHVSRLYY